METAIRPFALQSASDNSNGPRTSQVSGNITGAEHSVESFMVRLFDVRASTLLLRSYTFLRIKVLAMQANIALLYARMSRSFKTKDKISSQSAFVIPLWYSPSLLPLHSPRLFAHFHVPFVCVSERAAPFQVLSNKALLPSTRRPATQQGRTDRWR